MPSSPPALSALLLGLVTSVTAGTTRAPTWQNTPLIGDAALMSPWAQASFGLFFGAASFIAVIVFTVKVSCASPHGSLRRRTLLPRVFTQGNSVFPASSSPPSLFASLTFPLQNRSSASRTARRPTASPRRKSSFASETSSSAFTFSLRSSADTASSPRLPPLFLSPALPLFFCAARKEGSVRRGDAPPQSIVFLTLASPLLCSSLHHTARAPRPS